MNTQVSTTEAPAISRKERRAAKKQVSVESAVSASVDAIISSAKAPALEVIEQPTTEPTVDAQPTTETPAEPAVDTRPIQGCEPKPVKAVKPTRAELDAQKYVHLKTTVNPKRAGSAAFGRFELYVDGMTVAAAVAAGVTREDLAWDTKHGFIVIDETPAEAAPTADAK